MSIRLKLDGFEELIVKIQKAEGNINSATRECMEKSASIMQEELQIQMSAKHVPGELISNMPSYQIESNANSVTARVGYKKGAYNPNALSDGYKVVFLNYGTPRRKKHGKIDPFDTTRRGFIQAAKKSATPKIKKIQKQTLEEILKGLEQ